MSNTYTNNPQPGHTLANDQPTITSNFNYLVDALGTQIKAGDHQVSIGGTDTNAGEGRHRQVGLLNRNGSVPTVAGVGDNVNTLLYSNNGNVYLDSALLAGPYQLTTVNSTLPKSKFGALGTTSTTTPFNGAVASTNAGWSFLPGGLIFQYGQISNPSSSGTVNFPVTFPTNVLGVFFNFGRNASSADSFWINTNGTNNTSTFSFKGSTSSAVIFYWWALGN